MRRSPVTSPSGRRHSRRQFITTTTGALAGIHLRTRAAASAQPATAAPPPLPRRQIKLGFDNFSLRALGWKADQFLDYAATQKLDVMLFSDLKVYASHDAAYLRKLKDKADRLRLEIQVGTYSICPTSKAVTKDYGTPEEHLALAIRIAHTLGSPVVRCVLGTSRDRLVDGGIERQMDNTVKVLQHVRNRALDANVKIAVENHAGDMRAAELVSLIEAAGRDFVGATMDSGNAAWTLEDPLDNLERLGPYAVCTGIRDTAVWETPEGAYAQWTSLGEGNTDWRRYLERYAALCPNTPFVLEVLSEWGRPLPYLQDEFWRAYPNVRGRELARFIAFARKGHPAKPYQVPPGMSRQEYNPQFQRTDLEQSLRYCKQTLGLGLKG